MRRPDPGKRRLTRVADIVLESYPGLVRGKRDLPVELVGEDGTSGNAGQRSSFRMPVHRAGPVSTPELAMVWQWRRVGRCAWYRTGSHCGKAFVPPPTVGSVDV